MARFGVALAALLVASCGQGKEPLDESKTTGVETAAAGTDRACASRETYERLKELAFDEAARIRGDDSAALDQVAQAAVVRMEDPVMRERDAELNVITCAGRFILELPPGAENAFDGERRVTAEVRYAAQTAADGSGLVYQLENAEPIIYRLATIGGVVRGQNVAQNQPVTIPSPSAPPGGPRRVVQPAQTAEVAPPTTRPAPAPAPEPAPRTRVATQQARPPAPPPRPAPQRPRAATPAPEPQREARATTRPSFNCRQARSRSEQIVCGSGGLAALDRRMSALFYSALSGSPPEARAALRRSRNRFLAFRERCGSEACIAQAYRDRMDEIQDIAGGQ